MGGGEGVGAAQRLVEQGVDPGGAVTGTVEEGVEVPLDRGEIGIGDVGGGHAAHANQTAARPA
jgi:hypothetical protein